jgi:hypothetical protein
MAAPREEAPFLRLTIQTDSGAIAEGPSSTQDWMSVRDARFPDGRQPALQFELFSPRQEPTP